MRAVSWHDKAGVSSPVGGEARSESPSRLGPAFGWLRRRVGFGQVRLARRESGGTRYRLSDGLSAVVVGEPSWPLANGAHAELKVAGPHAVERQVVAGLRVGGLPDGHAAAGWLVLETGDIRPEVAAHRQILAVQRGPTNGVSGRESPQSETSVLA